MILKKHRIEIIALCLILSVNIYAQTPQRDVWTKAYWISDDVDNMNVANNLRLGNGFSMSYQQYQSEYVHPLPNNITTSLIFQDYPELNREYSGKGPPYYLLLGLTYWITDATEKNWNFWGSVLNGIITIFMLISLFFFSRKYFGLDIAIISTFIVSIATITIIYSVRSLHYPLTYLFIIISLFFIKKTRRDYILFGLFAGLANLTHPIGILPILGYGLLLLIKKEFKGLGIVFLSYFLVILPWLIRNVLAFHGYGYGMGFPYSDKISELLGLHAFTGASLHPQILGQAFEITEGLFPLDTFSGFYDLYLTKIWHVHTITFLLFFIVFSFISFEGIKKSLITIRNDSTRNKIFFAVKILVILSLAIFLLTSNIWAKYITDTPDLLILITQMILIFVFPIVLVVWLYKIKKEIFEIPVSRISLVIIFFTLVILLIYLGFSNQTGIGIPELKIVMPIFLIGLPLGIHGLKKIIKYFSEPVVVYSDKIIKKISNGFSYNAETKINGYKMGNYIFLSIVVLLCGLALLELNDGNIYWIGQTLGVHKLFSTQQDLYNWLNQNIADKKTIVASDISQIIWSQVGLRSVSIPTGELESYNVGNFESFIEKYNVTYIVMHYKYNTWILDNNLGRKYYFEKVYHSDENVDWFAKEIGRNYKVYRIYNLFDTNLTYPSASAEKAIVLKENGKQKEANEIYENLINSGQISKINLLTQFRLYSTYGNLNEIEHILDQVNSTNQQDFQKLVSSYTDSQEIKKLDNMTDFVNNAIDEYPNNFELFGLKLYICEKTKSEKSIPSNAKVVAILNTDVEDHKLPIWGDIVYTLTKIDDAKYNKTVTNLFQNATNFEKQGNYSQALKLYHKMQYVNNYTKDSLTAQIRILTKLKQYDEVLSLYDATADTYLGKMKGANMDEKIRLQKTLIDTLYAKADLLINIGRYDDANDVYVEIIGLDQFQKTAHEKRAIILDKLGDSNEAAREYDFVKRLELQTGNK